MDLLAYTSTMQGHKAALLADPTYASALGAIAIAATPVELSKAYDQLVTEGACSLQLIQAQLRPGMRILEVGAGAGFAHAWLRMNGCDVIALEPSESGHDGAYRAGARLLEHLGLGRDTWLSLDASQARTLGGRFDLVFSNNVLEHVADLDGAIASLAASLAPGGIMRHNCPNYVVPYEPHFGIPLVPFAPRRTELFVRRLRADALWRGLNFVTSGRLRGLARRNGLHVRFEGGHLHASFRRLLDEPAFGAKHPALRLAARILAATGLLRLLKLLPAAQMTPMLTTWSR